CAVKGPAIVSQSRRAPATPAVTPDSAVLRNVQRMRQQIAPLELRVAEHSAPRVNLLVPAMDFRYLFGSYLGKLNLAQQLRTHGSTVRLVIVDECDYDLAAWRRAIAEYRGLVNFFDLIEVAYAYDRTQGLEVSPADLFIATTWWTAHVAHRATHDLGHERFLYLIQEFEPMTFPMGSSYALALETYSFPHMALFSSELLREYFKINRLGVFSADTRQGDDLSV